MNYKEFNDYELLDQIHCCNEDANEILLYKYRPLIVNLAQKNIKYCKGGVDLNDLIQEGLLGLNEAINSFRNEKDANFGTFAKLCIDRRMSNLIKSTMTYKNRILNDYVPIDNEIENGTIDYFLADNSNNPGYMMESKEISNILLSKINDVLSDSEKEVFELKLKGFNNREISQKLNKEYKVIINCDQRIKSKLKKIINNI